MAADRETTETEVNKETQDIKAKRAYRETVAFKEMRDWLVPQEQMALRAPPGILVSGEIKEAKELRVLLGNQGRLGTLGSRVWRCICEICHLLAQWHVVLISNFHFHRVQRGTWE